MGRQQSIQKKGPEPDQSGSSFAEREPSTERAPGSDILGLQQTIGNRAVAHLLGSRRVQPKLRVGPPGDAYEQEADRMAEAVARGGTGSEPPSLSAPRGGVQRMCAECAEEEEKELRRKPADTAAIPAGSEFSAADMPEGGAPLGQPVRSLMEPLFHSDFGGVRIHTGDRAAAAADKVRARAFTLGEEIVFGPGEYRPDTVAGRSLLAHELTHVVQQTGSASSAAGTVQRAVQEEAPVAEGPAPTPSAEAAPAAAGEERAAATQAYVVEDSVAEALPGQMRKSEFLDILQTSVCAAADESMAGTGQTSADCPWIDYWFGYYAGQDAEHVEGAIRKFAPEAAGAKAAGEYIGIVTARVRRSVDSWAKTGEMPDLPEGATADLPDMSAEGGIAFKARSGGSRSAGSPVAIRAQLGRGRPLESAVRSRMETAFGVGFSGVRLHTGAPAAALSRNLNARAFTVGAHVAFGEGEYQPGTPAGDALIAHELAHVVQQNGQPAGSHSRGDGVSGALEQDADTAAVGAVASLWGGARNALGSFAANAVPRLRSGLRLQRCKGDKTQGAGWSVADLKAMLDKCDGGLGIWDKAKKANGNKDPSINVEAGGGFVDAVNNKITLDETLDKCNAVQQLIQELSNLSRMADFHTLDNSAKAGDVSRDDYIRRTELIEYETGVKNDLIAFDACKDKWPCPTARKEWARGKEFDDYFQNYLLPEHKEGYGKWWDDNCKAAYDAKHAAH